MLSAQDSKGTWFAIKRQLASDEQMKMAVIQEIRIMKEVGNNVCDREHRQLRMGFILLEVLVEIR